MFCKFYYAEFLKLYKSSFFVFIKTCDTRVEAWSFAVPRVWGKNYYWSSIFHVQIAITVTRRQMDLGGAYLKAFVQGRKVSRRSLSKKERKEGSSVEEWICIRSRDERSGEVIRSLGVIPRDLWNDTVGYNWNYPSFRDRGNWGVGHNVETFIAGRCQWFNDCSIWNPTSSYLPPPPLTLLFRETGNSLFKQRHRSSLLATPWNCNSSLRGNGRAKNEIWKQIWIDPMGLRREFLELLSD